MRPTFTEREALRQMVEYIKEERQRLWEEYVKITRRLSELDKIEGDIVNESNEGDDGNEDNEGIVQEGPEEVKDIKEKEVEETVETVEEPNHEEEIENMSISKDTPSHQEEQREEPNPTPIAVKTRPKTNTTRDIAKNVVEFMIRRNRPVRTAEIIDYLKEIGVETNSPYALLQQIRNYEPGIVRVKFGFYRFGREDSHLKERK